MAQNGDGKENEKEELGKAGVAGEDAEEEEAVDGEREGDGEEEEEKKPSILSKLLEYPTFSSDPSPTTPVPTAPTAKQVAPAPPVGESTDDLVTLSDEDRDFLFGTKDDMIAAPDAKGMSDLVDVPPEAREFLFGTDENRVTPTQPQTKVKYSVSPKPKTGETLRRANRAKQKRDRETDEFLFGTAGVL